MGQHQEKLTVDEDISDQVLPLFGTIANAQRLLRCGHVPYQVMREALRGNPVPKSHADDVVVAWRTWKQLYVRGLAFSPDMTFRLPETIELAYRAMDRLSEQEVAEWKRRRGRFHRFAESSAK
ncbi:hypothetical protein LCGC14_0251330 [marine sediment metagenome]|uniref:Uncharacterized protein n=1 Tax=marine sediment metagenome TaxID=412755 RepID=A0A0F9WPF9_9ZZZZ